MVGWLVKVDWGVLYSMSTVPETAAEIYETRLHDERTGATCARLLFGDLENAKEYLEEYALIRYGATSDVWKPVQRESVTEFVMHFDGDGGLRGVIQGRAIHAAAGEPLEAVREVQASTSVGVIE